MKQPLKQVNFYRRALAAGCAQGFVPDGQLCLHLTGAQSGAYFVSFDTADPDGTYHRLVVDGDFAGAKLEVIAAVSPADAAPGVEELSALLASDAPAVQKMAALTALPHVRAVNRQDILLHELEGRWVYLCVWIRI